MTYPIKFRSHVLSIREKEGLSFEQTAERFGVGVASVVRWAKRLEPDQSKPRKRKIDMNALRQDVIDYPDAYQYERAARFGVATNAIWQALRKLGVTYKKSPQTSKSERRQTARLPKSHQGL